ncbi:MAG: hypothetical protein WD690_03050 [Vicinamibacterales bacterium]
MQRDQQLVERLEAALARLRPVKPAVAVTSEEPADAPAQDPDDVKAVGAARLPAMCSYGCGTVTRCAELKATRPDLWAALHYTDPSEVARRDEEATQVMLRTSARSTR